MSLPVVMPAQIQLYLHSISDLICQQPSDFAQRRDWIAYQKQQLHAYRLACLNRFLASQLTQPLSATDLSQTDMGKPFLRHYPHCAFNHSHSPLHYALVISTDVQDLGVDVEDLSRKVRFEALAQHAFHAEEYQHWVNTGFDPSYWFQIWTTKEAVLKASGLGIRMSLNQLNTQCVFQQAQGRCQHAELGQFAYQHIQQGNAWVTLAWRDEETGQWPEIILEDLSV